MSVIDLIAVDLGPTATYSARRATFVPSAGTHADRRDGTLTIVLEHARRNKVESDGYAVVVEAGQVLLATQGETAEVYGVTLYPPRCTCKAGSCKLACKHLHAVQALAAESPGLFDAGRAEGELPECFRDLGPADRRDGVPF